MKNLMQALSLHSLQRLLTIVTVAVIVRVIFVVGMTWVDYFPPNFASEFLLGRRDTFYGTYQWAFYVHILSGPCSLVAGLILMNDRLRQQWPQWHRLVGKTHVVCVLLLVSPSGLWMAAYNQSGIIAGLGFTALAIATAATVTMGWRSAVQRQFAQHQLWMQRSYVLLCSAVAIRVIGGVTTVAAWTSDWIYPISAWFSWLVPLAIFEGLGRLRSPTAQ